MTRDPRERRRARTGHVGCDRRAVPHRLAHRARDRRVRHGHARVCGDVVFGNIGVPERLQFTVIGPTANEVARLESLTKPLGHGVLASDRFAAAVAISWQHLGLHELRGARTLRAVFALPAAS